MWASGLCLDQHPGLGAQTRAAGEPVGLAGWTEGQKRQGEWPAGSQLCQRVHPGGCQARVPPAVGPPWSLAAGELGCPTGLSHQPREVFRNVSQLKTASQSDSTFVRLDAGGGADVSPAQPHGRSTPPSCSGAGNPPPSSLLGWRVPSWFSGCRLAAAASSGAGGTVGQGAARGAGVPMGRGAAWGRGLPVGQVASWGKGASWGRWHHGAGGPCGAYRPCGAGGCVGATWGGGPVGRGSHGVVGSLWGRGPVGQRLLPRCSPSKDPHPSSLPADILPTGPHAGAGGSSDPPLGSHTLYMQKSLLTAASGARLCSA